MKYNKWNGGSCHGLSQLKPLMNELMVVLCCSRWKGRTSFILFFSKLCVKVFWPLDKWNFLNFFIVYVYVVASQKCPSFLGIKEGASIFSLVCRRKVKYLMLSNVATLNYDSGVTMIFCFNIYLQQPWDLYPWKNNLHTIYHAFQGAFTLQLLGIVTL